MVKLFFNLVLTSIVIIFAFIIIVFANNPRLFEEQLSKFLGKPIYQVEIYVDENGYPKYSQGACKQNADCSLAGCSKQFCSSNSNMVTTCEFRSDFPDVLVYKCGCIKGKCVWYKE